jgi:hypothetical protein
MHIALLWTFQDSFVFEKERRRRSSVYRSWSMSPSRRELAPRGLQNAETITDVSRARRTEKAIALGTIATPITLEGLDK